MSETFSPQELLCHEKSLLRFAKALTKNQDQAFDLVQDTFVRALAKREQFQPGTKLQSWLMAILYTRFINGKRREKASPKTVELPFGALVGAPPEQYSKLDLEDALDAMATLPQEMTDCLILISLYGYDYEATAKFLGVPVGTVRSRLSRGKDALRKALR